jgi:Protein of unknown function (DUF3109)
MIQLHDTIISEDLLTESFVCNLSKCKGICCVDGDAGAPLDEDELPILADIFPKIKDFLRPEGIAALEAQGTHVVDEEGDLVTPLVAGKECAYVIFEENGHTKCGIEKAYEAGVIDYQKPISCHLYPVRLQKYSTFTAVNYHEWDLCADACSLGSELKVKVYQFLKNPLSRKFGEAWYADLCDAAQVWEKEFGPNKG